jgi:hypothetical protein
MRRFVRRFQQKFTRSDSLPPSPHVASELLYAAISSFLRLHVLLVYSQTPVRPILSSVRHLKPLMKKYKYILNLLFPIGFCSQPSPHHKQTFLIQHGSSSSDPFSDSRSTSLAIDVLVFRSTSPHGRSRPPPRKVWGNPSGYLIKTHVLDHMTWPPSPATKTWEPRNKLSPHLDLRISKH